MANLKYRGNSTTPTKPTSTTAKNAPLTNDEIDGNLRSLNDSKLETTGWTAGDIFYADASGNLTRLPIGSTNQTLAVVGGLPAWITGAASTTDVQEFTTPGTSTWVKPSGAKLVHVLLIGGGGGGGSGGVIRTDGLTTVTMTGGAGGGGAGRMEYWINASELGATESITVGAAGVGGAGGTSAPSSNATGTVSTANAGTTGGFSKFALRYAMGGRGGVAAVQALNTASIDVGGNIGSGVAQVYAAYLTNSTYTMRVYASGYGGTVYATGSTGSPYAADGGDGGNSPGGGGAGGGIGKNDSTGYYVSGNGGKAGYTFTAENPYSSTAGHGYAGSYTGNGIGYTTETVLSRTVGGWGAGGGTGIANANAGNGGLGGWPGGGGGGGGSTRQGYTSGSGGNGNSGYVKITTFK